MSVNDLMESHYNYHLIADQNNQESSRKSTSTLLVIGLLLALIFIVAIMTLFIVYLKGMDNDFNNIIIYMYYKCYYTCSKNKWS